MHQQTAWLVGDHDVFIEPFGEVLDSRRARAGSAAEAGAVTALGTFAINGDVFNLSGTSV